MLTPSYCYAEDWKLPFEPKILVRDKSKYFDAVTIKNGKMMAWLHKISKAIKIVIMRD